MFSDEERLEEYHRLVSYLKDENNKLREEIRFLKELLEYEE